MNKITIKRTIAHRRNRADQRNHLGRKEWRLMPATAEQIRALRQIAMANGRTYAVDATTRGEAWKRIRQASVIVDEQLRARCAPPWYAAPKQDRRAA
jgi:hypothetical protein